MQNDFIITLAWPEGMVKATGAWYDNILSKDGKYRVGHSALALVNSTTKKVHYFDFGRYHTPTGFGRVRDIETDQDIAVIDAKISENKIANIYDILLCISHIKATHGEGKMYASVLSNVAFKLAYNKAKEIQKKGMVPYGPIIRQGTNCSRFVAKIIKASGPPLVKRLRLKYPFCISPSPKRNVCITNHHYYVVDNNKCIEVKKSRLAAYFTSIER